MTCGIKEDRNARKFNGLSMIFSQKWFPLLAIMLSGRRPRMGGADLAAGGSEGPAPAAKAQPKLAGRRGLYPASGDTGQTMSGLMTSWRIAPMTGGGIAC
jgi:hypothetical protein